jgi:hypothetical protein
LKALKQVEVFLVFVNNPFLVFCFLSQSLLFSIISELLLSLQMILPVILFFFRAIELVLKVCLIAGRRTSFICVRCKQLLFLINTLFLGIKFASYVFKCITEGVSFVFQLFFFFIWDLWALEVVNLLLNASDAFLTPF